MAATPRKVKLPQQLQAAEDLLLWSNVPKSAAAFGGATLLYVLLEWSGVPLLTWLSTVAFVAVLGTTLWAMGARAMSLTGPEEHLPSVLRTGLDEEAVKAVAERARVLINRLLATLNRLLSGQDLPGAGKALAALWVIRWASRFVSPVGLLYSAIVALFTLPKVYELKKAEIDSAVATAREATGKQVEVARVKMNELYSRLTPQKAARPAAKEE